MNSSDVPAANIGLIGYSGHGKTTYTISLLNQLNSIHHLWNNFYFEALDDNTLEDLFCSVGVLKKGEVLSPTRAIYPRPVFMHMNNIPGLNNQFVSFFDTGGKLFNNLDLFTRRGKYLAHSNVIFFFISLIEEDMKDNWNIKIMKLLDRYIHVVYSRYGIKTAKNQSIAFIITKADEIVKLNGEINLSQDIYKYLENSIPNEFTQFEFNNLSDIMYNSENIEAWLRSNNCNSFINLAKNHFRKIGFMFTSSIQKQLENETIKFNLNRAQCVLDPLIWAMHVTQNKV